MTHRASSILGVAVLVTLAWSGTLTAGTMTFTETFDSGGNEGGWTWGFGDSVPATGGNPGAYLRTEGLDTFAPQPRTTTGGPFTGNYREMGVVSIGVDLITFAVDFSAADRPLTLMLFHDNGTPSDPSDDTAAYFLGPEVPLEGEGWLSYDYDVPSGETGLPPGWQLLNLGDSGAPADHTWDEVIQDVAQVRFFYGDPTFFFIFQQWTLGLDNARITTDVATDPGDGRKVAICHVPPGNPAAARTLHVGAAALAAHMAHGDTLGACPDDGGLDAEAQHPAGPAAVPLTTIGARTGWN